MTTTQIFDIIFSIASILFTALIIPFLKEKITYEKFEKIKEIIEIAVTSAEQIYHIDGEGSDKKEFVVKFLAEKGIIQDVREVPEEINNMIESAVFEIKQRIAERKEKE